MTECQRQRCGAWGLSQWLAAGILGACLGLHEKPENVTAARAAMADAGFLGVANVAAFDGEHLPFIDNLANLVVLKRDVPEAEVMRVLCPGGTVIRRPDRAIADGPGGWGGGWQTLTKPRSRSIDEWTHYFHDAAGNPVAHDTEVGPPRHLQWVAHPRWSRHHDRMASMTSLVSASARLYLIHDEGSRVSLELPPHWQLVARDAFNGTLLWKREIPSSHDHMWPLKSGPTQLARRLVADVDDLFVTLGLDAVVSRLDGRTGETKATYEGTESTEEMLHDAGLLLCLVNHGRSEREDSTPQLQVGDQGRVAKEFLWNGEPREVQAIDVATGQLRWSHTDTYWFHYRCHIAKATDRFIIPSRTGFEFVNFDASHWEINHWVRGGCLYGVLPCNGLLYAFSVLTVPADTVGETLLAGRKETTAEGEAIDPQAAFVAAVFGRGRAAVVLPAATLTFDAVVEFTAFLCGACSCQVKQLNSGFDLLLQVDWEQRFFGEGLAALPRLPAEPAAASQPELVPIPAGRSRSRAETSRARP